LWAAKAPQLTIGDCDVWEPTVDTAERVPMTALDSVHTRAGGGSLAGKVIVLPTSA
jgi:hypothetical protein